jgi:hypothetical protein
MSCFSLFAQPRGDEARVSTLEALPSPSVRQIQGPPVELRGNRPAPREEAGNNDE